METKTTAFLQKMHLKSKALLQAKLILVLILLLAYNPFTANAQCQAEFYYREVGDSVYFINASTGSNLTYTWDFGDRSSSTQENPIHYYNSVDSYYVCLYISDSLGQCKDTFCQMVYLYNQNLDCQAYFFYNYYEDTAYFSNMSFGNGLTYSWNFGDGTSSTDENPKHYYSQVDTYTVCLTITDSNKICTDSICMVVFPNMPSRDTCNAIFFWFTEGKTVYLSPYKFEDSSTRFLWTVNNDTLTGAQQKYKFENSGKYKVCLYVSDSNCSAYYCEDVEVGNNFTIGGNIKLKNAFLSVATVYLIQYNENDSTLKAIDTLEVYGRDTFSYYAFYGLDAGIYYVKTALNQSDSFFSKFLPTYHDSELLWSDAKAIVLSDSSVYDADIYMISGQNSGGKGFISGKVTQGANKKEGDPLENIQITLLNQSNIPVGYTYSLTDGSFKIGNLPYGTYKLFAEIPGVKPIPWLVTISESDYEIENLNIIVNLKTAYTAGVKKSNTPVNINLAVYPNPLSTEINLVFTSSKPYTANIRILDVSGKIHFEKMVPIMAGKQTINLNTMQIPSGILFLRIENLEETETQYLKFLKVE